MKKILCSAAMLLTFSTHGAIGPIPISLNPIEVKGNLIGTDDISAPYASEVYTNEDIEKSSANTLYDFLGQNTSIIAVLSSGNIYSQKIDMRGFGINDGYQNIVITLNGHRLNNIDLTSQFLANISLHNIEKIEIIKGSGSIVYGDGAMAGAIHIYTKETTNDTIVSTSIGNHGLTKISFSTELNENKIALSLKADRTEHDGFGSDDDNGNDGSSINTNSIFSTTIKPTNNTSFSLSKSQSNVDVRYPDTMTLAEYNDDPDQVDSYTHQIYTLNNFDSSFNYQINNKLNVTFDYSTEDKVSEFADTGFIYNYDNDDKTLLLNYQYNNVNIVGGASLLDRERSTTTDITNRDNKGFFLSSNYLFSNTTFSLGARSEKVSYKYQPTTANSLSDNHSLEAYDIGFNKKVNENLSVFSNYNTGFQAPDIDRFFNFGGTFNEFIEPARIKTLNIGLNHINDNSKTNATVYYSKLKNEIYYYDINGVFSVDDINTNIDKSHKYGLEVKHKYQINEQFIVNLNYAYIIAKIDEENEGNGAYNGKDMPGVSKHNITLGMDYKLNDKINMNINHKHRSEAYAYSDFDNNNEQKQEAFDSTNISINYDALKDMSIKFSVENIFAKKNAIWINDDQIYPVNYTRNISLGATYKF